MTAIVSPGNSNNEKEGVAARTCCLPQLDSLFAYVIEIIQQLLLKFKNTASGLNDGEPSSTEETAEQRQKRRKKMDEARKQLKKQFEDTMDQLDSGSESFISKLPVKLRDWATDCIISVMRVITGLFTSVSTAIMSALKTVYQACKNLKEMIDKLTTAAIKKVQEIFSRPQGGRSGVPA